MPERLIADLVKWVEIEAPNPRFGELDRSPETTVADGQNYRAFRPVKNPKWPDVMGGSWLLSQVDSFILSRLERETLATIRVFGWHPFHCW